MILSGWKHRCRWIKPFENSGSVLVTVLAVMVILLLLFLAAFTYIANRRSFHIKQQNRLIARHLSEAGITRRLNHLHEYGVKYDTISFEAPNGGQVISYMSPWGPFALAISIGKYANQETMTTSLIGSRANKYFDAAITVGDESLPLVATGNTNITGDVNTGPLGITTGRMRGEAIVNENFHKGETVVSQSITVPQLDTNLLNMYTEEAYMRKRQCSKVLEGSWLIDSSNIYILQNHNCLSVENNLKIRNVIFEQSDNTEIKSIFVQGYVEIDGNTRISGLIEIISTGAIYVRDSAIIDNMILMTPDSIIIGGYSKFSSVAISSSKLIVKDNAELMYPSLLLFRDKEHIPEIETGIFLRSREQMESVCYVEKNLDSKGNNSPLIYLDSLSRFTGLIISQGKADLRGRVYGSVMTERFHYFLPPTTYVNWLKDFQIDRTQLDYRPVLPLMSGSDEESEFAVLRQDVWK